MPMRITVGELRRVIHEAREDLDVSADDVKRVFSMIDSLDRRLFKAEGAAMMKGGRDPELSRTFAAMHRINAGDSVVALIEKAHELLKKHGQ
jgi:hypothetical protein